MLSIRTLSIALATTAAFSVPAFAQDSPGPASGKHVSVVAGYSLMQPTRNPTLGGTSTEIDGGGTPTLGVTYHINDNWAVEAWGAGKVNHKINNPAGGKVGDLDAQPYSISGQYQFGAADQTIRPYVGLGYQETNYSGESTVADAPHVGVETAKGAVATVGADFNITPTWFARVDARYFENGNSDVRQGGEKIGKADLNPYLIGVGVGARF